MGDNLTMPVGLEAGTSWEQTFQKIAAYGAGRLFDSYAVEKLYKASSNTPYMMDDWGNLFTAGQPNPYAQNNNSGTFPMIFLLIGGAFLFLMLAKD
jgi:hypothetical protein